MHQLYALLELCLLCIKPLNSFQLMDNRNYLQIGHKIAYKFIICSMVVIFILGGLN